MTAGGRPAATRPADLLATLRLLERAVDATGSGIIISDAQQPDHPIIYVNPAVERITGYAAAEILGRNCRFLQAEDRDQPARAQLRAALVQGRETTVTLRNYRKDGTLFWNELHLAPVRDGDGRVTHFVGVQNDVTARRQAGDRLRLLAEAGPLLLHHADDRATLAAIARLLVPALADWCVIELDGDAGGRERVVALHREPAHRPLLQTVQLDPLVADRPALHEQVGAGLLARWPEAPARQALAALGFTACLSLPLRTGERTFGSVVLATGATRRLGRDDLALVDELVTHVALMLDNGRLRRGAEEAVRRRDDFLGAVSHDLKTPIAGIKGMAQVLRRRLAQGHPIEGERLLRGLDAIDEAANRLTQVISQLLDVARDQGNRSLSLERAPTDLVALLGGLVARHQAATSRHQISLTTPLPHLVGVYDADRLAHAIANLLTNAVTFSPDGGAIHVTLTRDDSGAAPCAVVTITDSGIGIPAADLPHIFSRFHRAGNVTPQMPGSGLGLTSVRQIVESHGGAIAVDSRPGAGATFTLRLPLSLPTDAVNVLAD